MRRIMEFSFYLYGILVRDRTKPSVIRKVIGQVLSIPSHYLKKGTREGSQRCYIHNSLNTSWSLESRHFSYALFYDKNIANFYIIPLLIFCYFWIKCKVKLLLWQHWLVCEPNLQTKLLNSWITSFCCVLFFSRNGVLAAKYIPLRIAFDHKTKRLHPGPTENAKWIDVCGTEDKLCQKCYKD